MDDRLAGLAAAIVGGALATVGLLEYLLPGASPPPWDPFATGVLVCASGLALVIAGGVAATARIDPLSVRAGTAVGVGTLAVAVLAPDALLFGGVFWLGLVAAALLAAATVGTIRAAG